MNKPDNDWLSEELKGLEELEAPSTLLPRVMSEVRARASRPWLVRVFAARPELVRMLVSGVAFVILVSSGLVNVLGPTGSLVQSSQFLRGWGIFLESMQTVLLRAQVWSVPLLAILLAMVLTSYSVCIAAAKTVQHLSASR
jgi:hypothetical protein